jgi:hypothetical protein
VVLQRQLAQLQQQQQEEGLAGEGVCEGAAGETTADDSTVNEQRTAAAAGASVAPDSSVVLQAALAAAEEAARGQQHQVALLTSQLSAATSRCERLAGELQRRPAASAVSAMVQQLAALSALAGEGLQVGSGRKCYYYSVLRSMAMPMSGDGSTCDLVVGWRPCTLHCVPPAAAGGR